MAQPGNKNAAKGRDWADALRHALDTYEGSGIARGQALRTVAKRVVELALAGDKDAWTEIGNRLDGKPKQQTEITGEGGGPAVFVVNVE